MEFLILWLACGGAAALALNRYNKGCIGCMLGLLLGPIGVVVALIMRSNAATEETTGQLKRVVAAVAESRRTEFRDERACPLCAETILAAAKVCKHCGHDVPPLVLDSDGEWRWPSPD
jgi:hypothetical protein